MLALTYCLFAALCGWLEAILYAQRAAESFTFNEHGGMILQRIAAALLVPLSMLAYAWHGWWLAGELLPAALLFPMAHDEAYNFTRLWLSERAAVGNLPDMAQLVGVQQLGSLDRWALHRARTMYRYGYQSASTSARNDFNGRQRTWLAIAGGVLLLALYLYLLLQ